MNIPEPPRSKPALFVLVLDGSGASKSKPKLSRKPKRSFVSLLLNKSALEGKGGGGGNDVESNPKCGKSGGGGAGGNMACGEDMMVMVVVVAVVEQDSAGNAGKCTATR